MSAVTISDRQRKRALMRLTRSATALAAGGLLLAACGGTASGTGSHATATTQTSPSTAKPSVVDLRASQDGRLLVDRAGRTLYLFEGDKAATSSCTGVCASVWPPYTSSGHLRAGSGVSARLLGTSARGGGVAQATYGGHPLYYYSGDSATGDALGQGLNQFGANWYVVDRRGHKIDDDS